MTNLITKDLVQDFIDKVPNSKSYFAETELVLEPTYDPPFEHLIRSIIFQQLSGKAASTIHKRFLQLFEQLTPVTLLTVEDNQLKQAGLSRQKTQYVKNVAREFIPGGRLTDLTTITGLEELNNQQIIDLFIPIKGIGEWTVQMYLIFGLGRLNVMPAKDLGVRKGIRKLYQLDTLPTPSKAKELTRTWQPLATIGSLLCWRAIAD